MRKVFRERGSRITIRYEEDILFQEEVLFPTLGKTVYEQLRVFRANVYFQYSLIRLHEKRNVPRFVTKA